MSSNNNLLSLIISDAQAADSAPAGAPSFFAGPQGQLLFMGFIFVVFYFLLIRPQTKRAKEHREMVSKLAKGDEVVAAGGILGRVTEVGEVYLTVEVADGLAIKVQRHAVTQVLPKGTVKGA